ncbi:MAG: GIY-YIG nuclease family protein [Ghiorsea sp.]|nr:GIY-YIG nuclease family protein [Ghiorsea sp.]
MTEATWYLYMIRCKGNQLYTGITTDVTRRFGEHQAGKGAKFLRGKAPLELVYSQEVGNQSQALKLEFWLKKQPKLSKEKMIQQGLPVDIQTRLMQ